MALLVYYHRIRDDLDEVEYEFGHTTTELDRTLTISKTQLTILSETPSQIYRAVGGRIMYRFRREEVWPEKGMIAS